MKSPLFFQGNFIKLVFILLLVVGLTQGFGIAERIAAHEIWDVSGGDLIINAGGEYTITGTTDQYAIQVNTSDPVAVTLDNVHIDVSAIDNKCAFNSGANVTVYLKGSNSLSSGYGMAGIKVTPNQALFIANAAGENELGNLSVTGGRYAASIGGSTGSDCGSVEIDGGVVQAIGGYCSAGIGGGYQGSGGSIKITGGHVTASSGHGAGIGSGDHGKTGGAILITGGVVTATSDSTGAGIGGGRGGSAGTIEITAGSVTATGGYAGAGIGGGLGGNGGIVKISGGTVNAIGGYYYGAGIGSGYEQDGGIVTIYGGTVTATGGRFGAGIGGGSFGNGGTVTIHGGSILARGGVEAENIGHGLNAKDSGTLKNENGEAIVETILPEAVASINPSEVHYDLLVGKPPYHYIYNGTGHGIGDTNLYFYLPAESSIGQVERIAGSNRYETAVKISQKIFETAETVVIASGENFPDALAGGILAQEVSGPILLTSAYELPNSVREEIIRLSPDKVYILGGRNSISESVETEIHNIGAMTIQRIAGDNRYATAQAIQAEVNRLKNFNTAYGLASGTVFADALPAAAYLANNDMTLLLEDGNMSLFPSVIFGGTAAIPNYLGVNRLAGANRYETAIVIAEGFKANTNTIVLASGENFPDALSAISLAVKFEAPIILNPKAELDQVVIDYLAANPQINRVTIIGGTEAINETVEAELKNHL